MLRQLQVAFVATALYLQSNNVPPARIRPNPIPLAVLEDVCNAEQGSLNQEDVHVCQYFQMHPEEPVLLDFMASVCGYKLDCSKDPKPVPKDCPISVGPGVLSKRLISETLREVAIEGVWQALNGTLACLHERPDFMAHIRCVRIRLPSCLYSNKPQEHRF